MLIYQRVENGWSTLVTTVTTRPGIMHFSWKSSGYTPFVQNLLDHVGTHTDQPLSRGAMFRKSVGCAWKTVQCCNTSRRRQVEVSSVMRYPKSSKSVDHFSFETHGDLWTHFRIFKNPPVGNGWKRLWNEYSLSWVCPEIRCLCKWPTITMILVTGVEIVGKIYYLLVNISVKPCATIITLK